MGWRAIGEHNLEGVAEPSACASPSARTFREASCLAYLPLPVGSGSISYRPASQVGDLDRRGAPLVCGRLRSLLLRETADEVVYREGVLARPAHDGKAVELRRCTGRPVVLPSGGDVENIDLADGILTWDTGSVVEGGFEEVSSLHGKLYRYNLATRRKQVYALPERGISNYPQWPHQTTGVSSHTRARIFWVATHTVHCDVICTDETWSVLSAPAN